MLDKCAQKLLLVLIFTMLAQTEHTPKLVKQLAKCATQVCTVLTLLLSQLSLKLTITSLWVVQLQPQSLIGCALSASLATLRPLIQDAQPTSIPTKVTISVIFAQMEKNVCIHGTMTLTVMEIQIHTTIAQMDISCPLSTTTVKFAPRVSIARLESM
jgi:hypothetical protein